MPELDLAAAAFLGVAAFAAAAVNAIAGGGSLLSFPALLAVGYPGVVANVTNLVALVPGYVTGALAYRDELADQGGRLRSLALVSALGCSSGTALLLVGSERVFDLLAPFLILFSCALLAAQASLVRALDGRQRPRGLSAAVFAASLYGGYFGAGLGIMLLAILGVFLEDHLQRLNALKGALSMIVGALTALTLAFFGPVAWGAALVMASSSVAGGWLGARLAQQLPAGGLRWGVVGFGVVMAIVLLAT